jgi:toxin-antitoxin system PIN domain toxin
VILLDVNLLLYAQMHGMPDHDRTKAWLDKQFESGMRVGLPWHSLLGFVRLASNPRMFRQPMTVADGWRQVRIWLGARTVWIPEPTERHAEVLGDLSTVARISMRDVMDAHLAALAIEHGLVLCSNDTGFARFGKLRWLNPLED